MGLISSVFNTLYIKKIFPLKCGTHGQINMTGPTTALKATTTK